MQVELDVARKVTGGKSKEPRRFGTLVRLADDVVADAKVVASLRGVSMAELLSDTLRPILKKAMTEELRKRVDSGK